MLFQTILLSFIKSESKAIVIRILFIQGYLSASAKLTQYNLSIKDRVKFFSNTEECKEFFQKQ